MPTPSDIEARFWEALQADRVLMLGLAGADADLAQPMTAQLDAGSEKGPIYIFTLNDTDLAHSIGQRHHALAHFASKGHDLFASIEGEVIADNDRATIDRLWSPAVAAWYEGGKDDPKLLLLRFEPRDAQIWLHEKSVFSGARLLLGRDPKAETQDQTAKVHMN